MSVALLFFSSSNSWKLGESLTVKSILIRQRKASKYPKSYSRYFVHHLLGYWHKWLVPPKPAGNDNQLSLLGRPSSAESAPDSLPPQPPRRCGNLVTPGGNPFYEFLWTALKLIQSSCVAYEPATGSRFLLQKCIWTILDVRNIEMHQSR